MKKILNANQLKYIAITAMLIDHIAWKFLSLSGPLGFIAHLIGRMTIPIMCYFIAEGYHKTKDVKRYALRLFVFAAISHIPFFWLQKEHLPADFTEFVAGLPETSVMWPLFLALIALIARNSEKLRSWMKITIVIALCALAFSADWMFLPIIWALNFDIFRDEPKKQMLWFAVTTIPIALSEPVMYLSKGFGVVGWSFFQSGLLLAIIPLMLYNGQLGTKSRFSKWVFYVFYPLHMLILALI